ncbi:MAG: hypothetical protein ACREIC_23785, partial [Limisphaerales bacterium]
LLDSIGNVVGIVAMRMDDGTAFKLTGALPQNVNYAVKSSLLLTLAESVPGLSDKLKRPYGPNQRKTETSVNSLERATALVLVY